MKNLGASDKIIADCENNLGLTLPEGFKQALRISNGLELPGGWCVFPVFDPSEPRKTCNHIVYENTKGRWSYMDNSFISIAAGASGNQLVLKKEGNMLDSIIYHWNHETNKVKKWGKDLSYLVAKASSRINKIHIQIQKSKRKNHNNRLE